MFKDLMTARLQKLHANTDPNEPAGGSGGGTPATPPADGAGTPPVEGGKSFTQEDIDKIIQQRLARERKQWEQQVEEEKRKATMTAEEKLKADLDAANRKAAEAEARVTAAERKASLTGRVVNVDAALKLLDPDKHLDDTGSINVDAFLKDHPYLAPTQQSAGPTAPNGGGGAQPTGRKFTEADLERMSPGEINANWDRIQADLKK